MFKKIVWLVPIIDDLFRSYSLILKNNGITLTPYPFNERCSQIGYKNFCSELKTTCMNADLLIINLWSGSHILSPSLIREIKAKAFVVLFSLDDEIYSTHISANYAQILDLVVSNDFLGKGLFDQLGVRTIYYPFHRFLEGKFNKIENKNIDVSFIGNIGVQDRSEYLDALRNSGFNVQIFGKGTKNGYLSREKYIETVLNTKINLNFTKVLLSKSIIFNEPWRAQSRQIKGRPFEFFALSSFCLSEWAPSSEFIFGKEYKLPQFFNKQDLLDKVAYFLKNENERNQIAQKSYEIYNKYYSAPKSLIKLFSEIHNHLLGIDKSVPQIITKPSIYYLQRANVTYWKLFIKLLKNKKPFEAIKTLIVLFNFKVFIYSILTFPYNLIKGI